MALASAASAGVPGIPGAVGVWLPGSPQAHEFGMLGGAWLPTPPPATPGGVGLGNDAGGGQVYDTGEDDENDDCPLDETALEDEGCDEPELPETLEDCRDPELLEELELLDELELRELLGEEDDEGCELALEDDRAASWRWRTTCVTTNLTNWRNRPWQMLLSAATGEPGFT